MRSLDLSAAEQQLLAKTLEDDLRELRSEIHHTDDHDYKDELKARERTLVELLKKLQA